MKKTLLLISFFIFVCSAFNPVYAEKIPVKITPIQTISTKHDEIEIGDWVKFEIVNDVYSDDKLYIKKGTILYGFVDFFHSNGWAGDSAEIYFKKFETSDINGKKVIINSPLNIVGNSLKSNDTKYTASVVLSNLLADIFILFRGAEIYIEPDTKVFNIFLIR